MMYAYKNKNTGEIIVQDCEYSTNHVVMLHFLTGKNKGKYIPFSLATFHREYDIIQINENERRFKNLIDK